MDVAYTIDTVSKKYGLEPYRLAAIAMQESSYALETVSCYFVKGKRRCDYCMMQVNDKTAADMGLNIERLVTDLEYCVDAGARVLKDFKNRYGKRESHYWTRYYSSKPENRERYKQMVERYQ